MFGLILTQIIAVPLILAIFTLIFGSKLAHKTGWLAFVGFLYTTLLSLIAVNHVIYDGGFSEIFNWVPSIGLIVGLKADGLSAPLIFIINLLSMAVSMYSIPYMQKKLEKKISEYGAYYALFLLFTASMLGTILSTNLLEFFIFYEFMLIPSYFLVAKWGYGERQRISLIYFLWTHIGALMLLGGILSTYAIVGSFQISDIPQLLMAINPPLEVTMLISVMMFVGLFIKMALFGVHVWLPAVHAEAPTPISSLLSPAMIGIGGYAIIRITMAFFSNTFALVRDVLSIWALITIIYGGILALTEDDLKRRLAYSSISQMGYILLGISSSNIVGISGAILHYISHGTCKALLFMVSGAIILQADGLRSIKKLGGLASNMPISAIATIIGFFGIMGIPPLNGFHSEWMIISGMITETVSSGSLGRFILAYASIVAMILTASYGIVTIQQIFFGPKPEYLETVKEAPLTVTIPLMLLIVVTVFLGIFPTALIDSISGVISSIFSS